jgi:hypothetical protein
LPARGGETLALQAVQSEAGARLVAGLDDGSMNELADALEDLAIVGKRPASRERR